jgi:mannan endo-1,4-beta-mannosidase
MYPMIKALLLFILQIGIMTPTYALSLKSQFVKQLKKSAAKGVMYGHQDDTLYGFQWKDEDDRSDIKDVIGMYPSVMSFDIMGIENGPDSSFRLRRIRKEISKQHARGGVVNLTWHATNPVTEGNSWDNHDNTAVRKILTESHHHKTFITWIDNLALFFNSLKTEEGESIPVIFCPWHESNGSWFWWGATCSSPEEYKELWRVMVNRLNEHNVANVIYAYSPGDNLKSGNDFLIRYPGDDIISVFGVEGYAINTSGSESDRQAFIKRIRKSFDSVSPLAKQRKKIIAFTETGMKHNTDTQWWTKALMPAIKGYPICYLVTWRNATNQPDECYGIYKGHPAEKDFITFASHPNILFVK